MSYRSYAFWPVLRSDCAFTAADVEGSKNNTAIVAMHAIKMQLNDLL